VKDPDPERSQRARDAADRLADKLHQDNATAEEWRNLPRDDADTTTDED
jgi:hypothetical protein